MLPSLSQNNRDCDIYIYRNVPIRNALRNINRSMVIIQQLHLSRLPKCQQWRGTEKERGGGEGGEGEDVGRRRQMLLQISLMGRANIFMNVLNDSDHTYTTNMKNHQSTL